MSAEKKLSFHALPAGLPRNWQIENSLIGYLMQDSPFQFCGHQKALLTLYSSLWSATDVPSYSCISKRTKSVEIKYRTKSHGLVAHVVIDSTCLKVYGEGEWKNRKHDKEKRRTQRKLNLAVDSSTHEVVSAEVTLVNIADNEVLPT